MNGYMETRRKEKMEMLRQVLKSIVFLMVLAAFFIGLVYVLHPQDRQREFDGRIKQNDFKSDGEIAKAMREALKP